MAGRQERKKRTTYRPITNFFANNTAAYFDKYLTLKLKIEDKLRLCPYEIKHELEKIGKEKIEECWTTPFQLNYSAILPTYPKPQLNTKTVPKCPS